MINKQLDADVQAKIRKARGTFQQLVNVWSSKLITMHQNKKWGFSNLTPIKSVLPYGAKTRRKSKTTLRKYRPLSTTAWHTLALARHLIKISMQYWSLEGNPPDNYLLNLRLREIDGDMDQTHASQASVTTSAASSITSLSNFKYFNCI